jgi:hypothetical protein
VSDDKNKEVEKILREDAKGKDQKTSSDALKKIQDKIRSKSNGKK